jgi:hypothetical protein
MGRLADGRIVRHHLLINEKGDQTPNGLDQSRCVATVLPANTSVMLRRAIVRSAFLR